MTRFLIHRLAPTVAVFLGAVMLTAMGYTVSAAKVRPYTKTRTLQNGLRLILIERPERPLVSFRILVRAGSKFDPAGKSGLANVTAQLLRQGAGDRSAEDFQRFIDSLGVRLRIQVTRDVVDISATVLRKELLSGTRLLRDMLMEQRFEPESFTRQIQRSVSAVYQASDAGYTTLSDFAYQRFFSGEAYGDSPLGEPEQLRSLALEDVRAFYRRFYQPDRISIIIAGDISARDYINEVHQALSPYPKNKHRENDTPPRVVTTETEAPEIFLLDTPGARGARIGFFALGDSAADTHAFVAELMLAHLLAGFPELSFLGRKLVAEEDLVSNLRAKLPFSPGPTLLEIEMDCTSDRVIDAIAVTTEALQRLRESRVSKRELEEGKNFYRGFYAMGFETAQDVTERFAELLRANLSFKGHDTLMTELNSLTQSDLRQTSERIFSPSRLKIVVRGDADQYAEELRVYGSVQVITTGKSDR